ncbi:MAG: DUF4332 domain-containing protein [Chloroflexi bacterium]|nr:MAG: DUF4332 domain-containing protein [Chloroflexota bacterium]MBL1192761.1 DUF4332 domain-containing protein [Chloroflexota bacterium]NOH10055.1 DUF4332 domain-containing protein [Chloroflexota bacterium]
MGYYIDLEAISIGQYKNILAAADLIPSRMLLKEDIEKHFDAIAGQNVENVEELRKILNNKAKLQAFAKESGVPEEYLTVLIREVRGYRQKPNKIKDFPNIREDVVQRLEAQGIKNTLQLFDRVLTPQSRQDLSSQTGIEGAEITRLTKLTDLSRIRWVNHTFAYVLLEAGYENAEEVARADHQQLYEDIKQLNAEREIYKGHIGLHDMQRCVEDAKDVSPDIEY